MTITTNYYIANTPAYNYNKKKETGGYVCLNTIKM